VRRFNFGCGASGCRPWAEAPEPVSGAASPPTKVRASRSVAAIANTAPISSQLILALDYDSLRVPGLSDGARHVDCLGLLEKAPAGNSKRGPHFFHSPSHISTPGRPCFYLAVLIECPSAQCLPTIPTPTNCITR